MIGFELGKCQNNSFQINEGWFKNGINRLEAALRKKYALSLSKRGIFLVIPGRKCARKMMMRVNAWVDTYVARKKFMVFGM